MKPSFVAQVCAADWGILCLMWSGETVQLKLADATVIVAMFFALFPANLRALNARE